ncbi:MAG: hypothetical protein J6S74_03750 [Alphaproteobacteria bacterium]|nr:hypothetical protein [Alphaproteobacteria bacterium]
MNDKYDMAINNFLRDVSLWLDERTPRDTTEDIEIDVTKAMWIKLAQDPRKYVEYDSLYEYVSPHEHAFSVRRGIGKVDNSMLTAVNHVLYAMKGYYQAGDDDSKSKLVDALFMFKKSTAKSMFEKMKYSFMKPEKALFVRQR